MLAAALPVLLRWPASLVWIALAAIALLVFAALDERRRNRRVALAQREQEARERVTQAFGRAWH